MYEIIRGNIDDLGSFEREVSWYLRHDYKLAGGLVYTHDRNIMQAVYREDWF